MSFVRKFVWGEDVEYGGEGWLPQGIPQGNAVSAGFALAHDALEHFPNCIGGFEGEMLALGQSMFIRYESGWHDRTSRFHRSFDGMLSSDIGSFLRNVTSGIGEQTLRDPGPVGEVVVGNLSDEEFDTIARNGVINFLKEEGYGEGLRGAIDARRSLPCDPVGRIANWMRLGYLRAYRRFDKVGMSCYAASELFDEIASAFDDNKAFKQVEYISGSELHVRIDLRERTARLYTVEEYA